MKIDLLYPDFTAYDVLKGFTKELHAAFLRAGVAARIVDLNDKASVQLHLSDLPEWTLAFNGLLPDVNGKFLSDFTGVPHVAWLLDAPERFRPLLQHPKTEIAVIDEGYLAQANRLTSSAFFLPHAIDPYRAVDLTQKRTISLLFPASFVPPTDEESEREQAARKEALQTLAGFEVTVAGRGGEGKGKEYLGEVSWDSMRQLFEKTRLVLQVTPKITAGSHERVLEALFHGALPLSTPNRFLADEFPEVPQYHNSEELVYWVERLLGDEEERKRRVEASRPRLLSHHTWDCRVATLLSRL
jgi:hypothetical protein